MIENMPDLMAEAWEGYRSSLLNGKARNIEEENLLRGTFAAGVSIVAQLVEMTFMDTDRSAEAVRAMLDASLLYRRQADEWLEKASRREFKVQ